MAGKSFRVLLARDGPVILVGAHTGLGAKLAEEAGFDGVWASGLEISASCGIPDANILTVSENLAFADRINEPCNVPVLCDCDNGYGDAKNVAAMARKYVHHGLAGICIEDNPFPKQNSFYGKGLDLEDIAVFSGKIRAAKSVTGSDFLIVARTEALIQGLGMEEARDRAHAYADAGADAVLIHSKKKAPDEILEFARAWDRPTPLVAVPTTYNTISADDLYKAGYKMIIFANHGLRACITALRSTFGTLKKDPRGAAVDGGIATIDDVFRLSGKKELDDIDKEFIPKLTSPAIVLAAGKPRELDIPQALLEVRGKTILEHIGASLRKSGIEDIVVIRGYQKERFTAPGFIYVDNDAYGSTHILHSLLAAGEHLANGFLCVNGDVLFDPVIINNLLKSKSDIVLSVDRAWIDNPTDAKTDLVKTTHDYSQRRAVGALQSEKEDAVLSIGQDLDPEKATGEFTGISYFNARGSKALLAMVRDCEHLYAAKKFHEAPCFKRAAFTDAIQELIDRGMKVGVSNTYKEWTDVDSFAMLEKAQGMEFP